MHKRIERQEDRVTRTLKLVRRKLSSPKLMLTWRKKFMIFHWIAQLVKRHTGVPEGASSNPAQVNCFPVDVSSVRKSLIIFLFLFLWEWFWNRIESCWHVTPICNLVAELIYSRFANDYSKLYRHHLFYSQMQHSSICESLQSLAHSSCVNLLS